MLLLLSLAVYVIGMLCRIQHWPFGAELSLIGCIGIGIFSLLFFSLKSDKSLFDKMALVGLPLASISILVRTFHLPFASEVHLICIIIGLGYSIYLLVGWLPNLKSDSGKLRWDRVAFLAGAICVGIGAILKMIHWPFASEFLWTGLGLGFIHFFWGMFTKDETEESDE